MHHRDAASPVAGGVDGRHRKRAGPGGESGRRRHRTVGWRHPTRPEDVGHLYHPNDPRPGSEVSDDSLDCTGHRPCAVLGLQRPEFDRVELAPPCPDNLQGTDGGRGKPSLETRRADHAGRRLGRHAPSAHRHAPDHAVDAVPGGTGVGKALEHEDNGPFTGRTPIAGAVERRGGAIGEHAVE